MPPHMLHQEGADNPFLSRLSRIQAVQNQIEQASNLHAQKSSSLASRVQDLSDQIRKPVKLPWLKNQVELKKAVGLIQKKVQELNSPTLSGDSDTLMSGIEEVRDRLLTLTSKLNAAYDEIDEVNAGYQEEVASLQKSRIDLIHEFVDFHAANWEELSVNYPDELRLKMQSLFELFVTPYIEDAVTDTKEMVKNEALTDMKAILNALDNISHFAKEFEENLAELENIELEEISVPDAEGTGFYVMTLKEMRELCNSEPDTEKLTTLREEIERSDSRTQRIREKLKQVQAVSHAAFLAAEFTRRLEIICSVLGEDFFQYEDIMQLYNEIMSKIEILRQSARSQ
ncbi:MAG: hypothetical protein K1X28_00195 [Parachlamydiales bacterium]|nr:hypothetical protein [Parachlamydiales bacterium]